ncbi:branched-chain alpha-keto acid dehydrogenase E1 component alpha chain, partial [Haematococcus lacustris]
MLARHLSRQLKLPNYSTFNAPEAQLEHPAGRVPYTEALTFLGGPTPEQRIPAYRTLTDASQELDAAQLPHPITQALGVKMYQAMASLQTLDTLCYEAQRQGRMSFYLTSTGEEATVVGSAAALDPQDMVFAQGRQMPIHYGSRELCYQTISSPLATQMPHAVGAAYAMKLSGASTVAVAFFGEGAASEGDAHAALQFAATLAAPVLFICRNNGYAISTPASEQYKGDGIAGRAAGYGMAAVRVDGGDARAVYNAVAEARRLALQGTRLPAGHRYRTADEMRAWRARDPVSRFRGWLQGRGWWDEMQEQALRVATRKEVMDALDAAAAVPKPPVSCLFTDVYKNMPGHLKAQMDETFELVKRHPELVPLGVPVA